MRTAVLVSGGGTNLQALIDREAQGTLGKAELVGVISNNRGVYALERAKKAGIPAFVISPADFASRDDFHKALIAKLKELEAELIVLAGCLLTIPPEMIRRWPNRIINIHPALIPAFSGKGCYGIHVHEKALARGVKVSGATVHIVNENLDEGPILLQKAVEVHENDTPETLQRRIMEEAEWVILPEAVKMISEGQLQP
ncbi:MAG: phosphoribosylglycinamide formyltransferase [Lachnospiraceae bacterium]|nr:phosphoribosylglycinamide formyltransferase [Lachnospiraceae bacterium]